MSTPFGVHSPQRLSKLLVLVTFVLPGRVAQLAEQRTFKGLSGFPLGLLLFRLGPLQSCRSPEQLACFPAQSAGNRSGRLRLPAKVPALRCERGVGVGRWGLRRSDGRGGNRTKSNGADTSAPTQRAPFRSGGR